MVTFRQKVVVFLISLVAAFGLVSQLPWAKPMGALGLFWDVATSKTLLPLTIGLALIFLLLLWWNPTDSGQRR